MKITITKEWFQIFAKDYMMQELSYVYYDGDSGRPYYHNQILQLLLQSDEKMITFKRYTKKYLNAKKEERDSIIDQCVNDLFKN